MNIRSLKALCLVTTLSMVSCAINQKNNEVVCAKVEFKGVEYCSVPFAEMQANYNNLNNLLVAASGVLSVHSDVLVLVDPSTRDFDVPQPYNVVEIRLNRENVTKKDNEEIKSLHGKYVQVLGRFKAKNDSDGEWKGLISHSIENAYVIASFD